MSSEEGDIVVDFFCGSGTTAAVTEKLGRRWITADLGRLAIHTTRKRMLEIDSCKPFVISGDTLLNSQWQKCCATENNNMEIRKIYGKQRIDMLSF
jgi:DNA modification methylase